MKSLFRRQPAVRRTISETERGDCVYAIGDVHGRHDLLQDLLQRIEDHAAALPAERSAYLIFLGDLVDRGPDVQPVLRFIHDLERRSSSVVVLAGNHEDLMIRALDGEAGMLRAWVRSGGGSTLRSFGVAPPERGADPAPTVAALRAALGPELEAWLRARPLTARSGDYFFCHAGVRPGRELRRQARADLLWIRDEFLEDDGDHGAVVVHGHSIADAVEFRDNRIGVDTGAYATGVLTALYLDGPARAVIATAGEALPAGA